MNSAQTKQLPAHWPFATEAEHAQYQQLRTQGYAALRTAHELHMLAYRQFVAKARLLPEGGA